jgi:hypothetical protein
VAALRTRRHFIGYDNDPAYVQLARQRVQAERARGLLRFEPAVRIPAVDDGGALEDPGAAGRRWETSGGSAPEGLSATRGRSDAGGPGSAAAVAGIPALARAWQAGSQAKEFAAILLEETGFTRIRSAVRVPATGVEVSFTAANAAGQEWTFELAGSFSSGRSGLRRADVLWRSLGKAAVLHAQSPQRPFVLLTTDLPARGSAGRMALESVKGPGQPVSDVIQILDVSGIERLRSYAAGGRPA